MSAPSSNLAASTIEVVPHMKFELGLSLHVLAHAKDHHALFVDWAERVQQALSPQTAALAAKLIQLHEWQLGSLLRDYTGPSAIEDIAAYVERDPSGEVLEWATKHSTEIASTLQSSPGAFGALYADFLRRYYAEGFGVTWEREHWPLILESADIMRSQLRQLDYAFLERRSGRNFPNGTKLLLFPSSFSRPRHGYGFDQQGSKVVLYRVRDPLVEIIGTAHHELLHPLIAGWLRRLHLETQLERLAAEPAFQAQWEVHGKGNYQYPEGWLDELLVHALGLYFLANKGLIPRAEVANHAYCDYERAIDSALFANYTETQSVDGFIPHVLAHIVASGTGADASYRYVP
jgi:hypothetical protein